MPLHPQAQEFLQSIAALGRPAWQDLPPHESRRLFQEFALSFAKGPEMASVSDANFNGVPARIYRPSHKKDLPVVVYFHGGGWVIGNLETHDSLCRLLAAETKVVVIAVDYRLAPESKYPAAVEDACNAVTFVGENATQLSIDADRIMVAGDSAGGNLAAAVSLSAEKSSVSLVGQVLIYPVIERNFNTQSYEAFAAGYGLTRETMRWFWKQYADGLDAPYADLSSADLAGAPPTHVITAEYDVLRDEGEAFAARLLEAGVRTSLKRYAGMLHAFVHYNTIFDDGRQAVADIAAAVTEFAS